MERVHELNMGSHANELALIAELANGEVKTQREISENIGISLGLTNLLIKRLVRKGYLKAKQLDWNRTQYLLTLKGSTEKVRESYNYAAFIWEQAHKIRVAIQETVLAQYRADVRSASVVAYPETASLIRQALLETRLPGLEVDYVTEFRRLKPDATVVFAATVEPLPPAKEGRRIVQLLDKVDLEFRF